MDTRPLWLTQVCELFPLFFPDLPVIFLGMLCRDEVEVQPHSLITALEPLHSAFAVTVDVVKTHWRPPGPPCRVYHFLKDSMHVSWVSAYSVVASFIVQLFFPFWTDTA